MNKEIIVNELLEAVLGNLPVQTIHPIHKAMLGEACEHLLNSSDEFDNIKQMERAVHLSFLAINPVFQYTMNALLEHAHVVNVNYRGLKETLTKDSPILKSR